MKEREEGDKEIRREEGPETTEKCVVAEELVLSVALLLMWVLLVGIFGQ